jgi:hypothetical protein
MEILNMLPDDVTEVTTLIERLKVKNPNLASRIYPMPEVEGRIAELEAAVNTLSHKIDRIFANHVLIDGRFRPLG